MMLRRYLNQNYRCLYGNSEPLVAEMRSQLSQVGVDVSRAERNGSLVLFSNLPRSDSGRFDPELGMNFAVNELQRALNDGFAGLFATGDMAWELGPDCDHAMVRSYEQRLDAFVESHPQFTVLCLYHGPALSSELARVGLATHQAMFFHEHLSVPNPAYVAPANPES